MLHSVEPTQNIHTYLVIVILSLKKNLAGYFTKLFIVSTITDNIEKNVKKKKNSFLFVFN